MIQVKYYNYPTDEQILEQEEINYETAIETAKSLINSLKVDTICMKFLNQVFYISRPNKGLKKIKKEDN